MFSHSDGLAGGSALVDAVLTEAGIDKEHHKLIFELEVNSYGLFERCTSQTQACILLEWLLQGDSDCCSYQNALNNALIYEQALIGNMVPAAMCRVLHRHVCGLISYPFCDHTSPKTLQNLVGSIRCGQTHAMRNSYIGQLQLVERITERASGMPNGFTPRHLWQTWLPGCFEALLATAWSSKNSASVVLSIQCLFSIGYATALAINPSKPIKQLTSWLFLGTFIGCQKFILEYTSLFFKDLVWIINNMVHAPGNTMKTRIVHLRSLATSSRLLRLDFHVPMVTIWRPNEVSIKKGSDFTHLVSGRCGHLSFLTYFQQAVNPDIRDISKWYALFLRIWSFFYAQRSSFTSLGSRSSGIDKLEYSTMFFQSYHFLTSKLLRDSEVILLNLIQCIRASSRIRRLSLKQLDLLPLLFAIQLLSGDAIGVCLPCVVLGTLSSATESSLSLEKVMESCNTFRQLFTKQDTSLTRHGFTVVLSTTYEYNRLLEKFFLTKILPFRKWLHAVDFPAQLFNQHPRACSQAAALIILNSRVQSRALSTTPSHSTSQTEALLDEDKCWSQWILEHELLLLYKQAVHADLLRA